ncbi:MULTISPECIES: hypothetical protein [unclassified Streptomyces]|uniref:hypothetical protein n=1 Tax=unclassified Streptomyces TaxID=2593676 RepID=UPI00093C628A|nr:hypothetical protein [Streptomyces sp. TSRI0281]OKI35040.1 hypothetical protein A6A29_16595 [Streptomyces sp. TSRI0281]
MAQPGRTLTAAASRYTSRKIRGGKEHKTQGWQLRAYDMYHQVPEVRFAATWIGSAMAGARLYAGTRDDDGSIDQAPKGHRAAEIVEQIAGGSDGQGNMLSAFGKHLTIPGEGWIVVRPNSEVLSPYAPEDGHDWRVLSVREVKQQAGKLVAEIDGEDIPIEEGDPDALDTEGAVALRVWEPDPERAIEADSPVRSSLDLLEELLLLNSAVKAIARSRLTGRGLLLIPKGTRFPTSGAADGAEDDLLEVFMTIAETAIRDPESAAATVPIILEVPAEAIADFKHLSFESTFDELALKLREEAVRRFAVGLDVPAEILLGLGDVNHWGQWALTSEAIRLGIEPKLRTLCHALTQQWLRPLLEAEGIEDWHRWLVWFDTSPLRVRTNRSETALQAHDRGVISDDALRRETGFDDSDAPSEQEIADRNSRKQPAGEGADQADETPPPKVDLPVDESEAPPETLPASAAGPAARTGLLDAADVLIWSALTAAGKTLRNTPACPRSERARYRDVDPATMHTLLPVDFDSTTRWRLLDGAWARVPEIARRHQVDPECLTASLDDYVRGLIAAGIGHDYDLVSSVLAPCLGLAA